MGAPLISNLGFTEVNSAGSLNTKAGAKINLPIQLYKLTDNVSGQLELSSTANHKKVILDTNGFNIENSSDAPLNMDTPGSVKVEIKGNGAIKGTGKSTTIAQGSASHTGTSTAGLGDTSTVAVDTNHTYTDTKINDIRPDPGYTYGNGGGASWNDNFTRFNQNSSMIHKPGASNGSNNAYSANSTYYNTTTAEHFGGPGLDNVLRDDFSMTFTHAFMEDGNRTDAGIVGASSLNGTSGSVTVTNSAGNTKTLTVTEHTHGSTVYRIASWNSAFQRVNSGNAGPTQVDIFIAVKTEDGGKGNDNTAATNYGSGKAVVQLVNGRPSFCQIRDVKCFGTETGRRFVFTNTTDHTVTLSGISDITGMSSTVASGGTAIGTVDAEDGSYSITHTLPDTDGSGNPLSMHDLNKGTALLDSSQHTGITSVKGF